MRRNVRSQFVSLVKCGSCHVLQSEPPLCHGQNGTTLGTRKNIGVRPPPLRPLNCLRKPAFPIFRERLASLKITNSAVAVPQSHCCSGQLFHQSRVGPRIPQKETTKRDPPGNVRICCLDEGGRNSFAELLVSRPVMSLRGQRCHIVSPKIFCRLM